MPPSLKILAFVLALPILALDAQAATITWTGGADGNWFNSANWSPAQVPTSVDDAVIDANASVLIGGAVPATFNTLILGNTSGTTAPALRVSGTISTSGGLTVQRGAMLRQETTQLSTVGQLVVADGGVILHPVNVSSQAFTVNLAVTGNLTVQAGASITADGAGYAGGNPKQVGHGPGGGGGSGSKSGAGGGHGGLGGDGTSGAAGGGAYDNLTSPSDFGSGGGGSQSVAGGPGGGRILLQVGGVFLLDGLVSANGAVGSEDSYYSTGGGGGGGGTVNIAAVELSGSGSVRANGGAGRSRGGSGGGGGRVSITISAADSSALGIQANPGFPVAVSQGMGGGAGVIALRKPGATDYDLIVGTTSVVPPRGTPLAGSPLTFSSLTLGNATVLIDALGTVNLGALVTVGSATLTGGNLIFAAGQPLEVKTGGSLRLSAESVSGGSLRIRDGGILYQMNAQGLRFASGEIESGGLLTHALNEAALSAALTLDISGSLFVRPGGGISADGTGFAPGTGPGAGVTVPESFGGGRGSGGGYGGQGGAANQPGGEPYGSLAQPSDMGSGGGGITSGANVVVFGGRGGGRINISAGTLRVDGRISADGQTGALNTYWGDRGGGGSGGTVLITAQQLEGMGLISANGGASSPRGFKNGGGGSGGRVKISYGASVFIGTIAARGGLGRQFGGAGTVVYGTDLRIDNGISGASTTILAGTYAFQQVTVGSNAVVEMEAGAALSAGAFLTQGNSTFTNRGSLTLTATAAATEASVLRLLSGSLSVPRLEARTGGLFSYEGGTLTAQEAETASGGALSVNTRLELARLLVASGGVVTHEPGDADFDLAVSQTLTIESGGAVTADAVGFPFGTGPGAGLTVPENFGGGRGSGGGYGGYGGGGNLGGNGDPQTLGGSVYGSLSQPSELGSGGGSIVGGHNVLLVPGGRGGGRLRIDAGTLRVDGRISADGQTGGLNTYWGDRGGGGSGGSVLITAQQLEGTGVIRANGGASSPRGQLSAGGGGGGRIALYYTTKVGAQTVVVNGGLGRQNGSPGTILDNGVLSGTMSGSSATLAFSQMQERLSATKTLGDTLSAQLLNFAGATSTGVPTGTFSLAELRVVLVKTGPFANKGFFRGRYTLAIPAGEALTGEWEGMAFFPAGDVQRMVLKGALKGRLQGVMDGSLTESSTGSGVFDRLTASCRLVQVGDAMGASTIYISGSGSVVETAQYPGTTLNFLQATQGGEVGGYYSTPVDIAFTLLRVDSPGNPYHGEGFFAANYDSPLGSGQGWAYAVASGGSARLAGPFEQSLKGLMEGVLTLNSPRSLLLTLRNLDAGLPLQAEVTTSLEPAGNTPVGGVATVVIEVRNDGYAVAEGVTVMAVAPEKSRFLSASGNHRTYNVTHWRGSEYTPKPFIRWDFAPVPARSSQKMSYQVRLPPATPSSVQAGIDVRAITTAWADTIYAGYQLGETP